MREDPQPRDPGNGRHVLISNGASCEMPAAQAFGGGGPKPPREPRPPQPREGGRRCARRAPQPRDPGQYLVELKTAVGMGGGSYISPFSLLPVEIHHLTLLW